MILSKIISILSSGGWLMFPLFALAILIYTIGFDILFYLKNIDLSLDKKRTLKSWILDPKIAPKAAGEIIRYSQEKVTSSKHLKNRFEELKREILHPIERKLLFLNTLVASAPLMGLLGTVIGMLSTFSAISSGGGSETVDMVASGISEALITTQTGLFIALPGIFLILLIKRQKNNIASILLRLESQSLTVLELK